MKARNGNKSVLMAILITGITFSTMGIASATTLENNQIFELDPMIVTAQKMSTSDLKTASSIKVISRKDIEKSGATNAFGVLQNTDGVQLRSTSPSGVALGTITSDIIIRGVSKGTLVMLNGVPLNQDGKYNLEDIDAEDIEKIEVVRGGGSVLYGSEASGGVVNIITRDTTSNIFKTQLGNYGREKYYTHVGDTEGKFSLSAGYSKRGRVSDINEISYSSYYDENYNYDYKSGESKNLNWQYKINDRLTFRHDFSESDNTISRYIYDNNKSNKTFDQNKIYSDRNNMGQLVYDDGDFKANLSYGIQERKYEKQDVGSDKSLYSWREGHNTNIDLQKKYVFDDNVLLVGGTLKREGLDLLTKYYDSNYKRDLMSIYTSYNWAMSDDFNTIINLRETWSKNSKGSQTKISTSKTTNVSKDDVNKFTPEVQFIKQIDDNSSVYAKVGKSFRMPNLTQLYGSSNIIANPSLKPETGVDYEIGYKWNTNKQAWRTAIYHYKIKDSMIPTKVDGDWIYYNEDMRNTGIELSVNTKHDENFSSNLSVAYGNPQKQSEEVYDDNAWHDYLGKIQVNGSLNYVEDKFDSSISFNYVAKRTKENYNESNKPQLFTDLHFGYSPIKNHKITLDINNVLDRQDVTSNGDSDYYTMGINYLLGYQQNF